MYGASTGFNIKKNEVRTPIMGGGSSPNKGSSLKPQEQKMPLIQ
jgi:hypothetical protein